MLAAFLLTMYPDAGAIALEGLADDGGPPYVNDTELAPAVDWFA